MPTATASPARPAPADAEAGFSLIEVVVALMLLGVSMTAVAGILIGTLGVTRDSTQRVAAANLAQQQIETVRSQRALDIPDGVTTPVSGLIIDGTTYTVTQEAQYLTSGASGSLCKSAGSTIAYKRVTQTVTWPDMGATKPVRADTLVSLGLNGDGLSNGSGVAAVLVQNATGQPVGGIAVTLTPAGLSQTTGADGCAVFTSLTPGSYGAAVDVPGFVGIDGGQAASTASFTVAAAEVVRPTLDVAPKGALAMTPVPPAGYTLPAPVPVSLDFALFTPQTVRAFPECPTGATQTCVTGNPVRTASSLFPGVYTAWAGTCADSRPASAGATSVPAGASASLSLPLGGVKVQVRRLGTLQPVSGKTVFAVHLADAGCPTDVVYQLPDTSSDTQVALPQGTWTFASTPDLSSPPPGGWNSATLVAGGANAMPCLVVIKP